MPLFSNTSGVNIHGGSFYDVSGDMNVQNNQQLVIQDSQADYHDPMLDCTTQMVVVLCPKVIRNNQQTGTGQSLPYDASFRHQTRSQKHSSPTDDSFYDQPHIHPDAYNTTAPLPHLRNVNTPGGMHLETNQQVMIRDGQADCHDPWAALGASLSSTGTIDITTGCWIVQRGWWSFFAWSHQEYSANEDRAVFTLRRPSPADDSSYDQLNNPLDNYDTAHLWSGVEFGPDNGSMSSYPPWTGNTHNPERGTSINGGTFIGGNVNNVVQGGDTGTFNFAWPMNIRSQLNERSGLQILHREVSESLQAMHDSRDSYAQPKCHPDTRTEMLEKLYNWCITSEGFDGSDGTVDSHSDMETPFFEDVTERQPVLWLHGPAGAGKSALMRTLAERLATSGHLGGSFFFKRGHPTRGNARNYSPPSPISWRSIFHS
ncbi:hypothetical protein C8J57DRAFT_1672817 [Mycena rebaudengoi]|nr:hypothetical protein C8J57DRAFT_1672817 [Mycena rebaudengoi]